MPENQYSVSVPNPLQALMLGEQSYKEQRTSAVREEAAKSITEGGDPKAALGRLLSIGDDKGANTLAGLINSQQQADYQNKSLAETSRFHDMSNQQAQATLGATLSHYKAIEGQSAAQLAEQRRQFDVTANGQKVPPGFRTDPNNPNALIPVTGGPTDPAYIQSTNAAKDVKPIVVPYGSGLVKPDGTVIREPSGDGLLDDQTLVAMANQYRAGDTSIMANLGRGAQGAQNIVRLRQKITELNSGAGETGAEQANRNAEMFGVKAGQRTLGTKQANIEMASTEFEQVLPVVAEASKAVSRTNYPDLNRILQAGAERTGDPNIVRFGGGVNTLINLYARAISPSGTATVSDKDHAREILQKAWSQGQFEAATGMMKMEIQAAKNSPEKVREEMRARFLSGQSGASSSNLTGPGKTITGIEVSPIPPSGVVDYRTYFGGR